MQAAEVRAGGTLTPGSEIDEVAGEEPEPSGTAAMAVAEPDGTRSAVAEEPDGTAAERWVVCAPSRH